MRLYEVIVGQEKVDYCRDAGGWLFKARVYAETMSGATLKAIDFKDSRQRDPGLDRRLIVTKIEDLGEIL